MRRIGSFGAVFVYTLLMSVLTAGSAFADYTSFPDLGVVGDHRMMTVIGFAQQSFYFDLFSDGQLQSLALLFALIGGLLILLLPKFQKFTTIACYLFLVFILIVHPKPSEGSLFFYPLGEKKGQWNCPLPQNGTTPMEIMCKMGMGVESNAGTISDSLSEYANNNPFGAFVPQLATIHFFTAIERTLILALWGSEENKLQMTDLFQGATADGIVANALESSMPLRYSEDVYNNLCGGFKDEINTMLWNIDNDTLVNMANRQFTFNDLIAANRIFYDNGYVNHSKVYPAIGATAYLNIGDPQNTAFAKSLVGRTQYINSNYKGAVQDTDIVSRVSAEESKKNLVRYRSIIDRIESTNVSFPISSKSGYHVFKNVRKCSLKNKTMCLGYENTRDPDPYSYEIKNGEIVKQNTSGWSKYIWSDDSLDRKKIPASWDEFYSKIPQVTSGIKSNERELIEAMYTYPVQIFFPWWLENATNPYDSSYNTLKPAFRIVDQSLQPRIYLSQALKGGTTLYNFTNEGTSNSAVQSCVDLAAMIQLRRWKVLEEVGIFTPKGKTKPHIRVTDDDGMSPTDLAYLNSEQYLKDMMGTPFQGVAEEIQRLAKAEFTQRGYTEGSGDTSAVISTKFMGWEIDKLSLCKGESGMFCDSLRTIKKRFNKIKDGGAMSTNGITGKAIYQQGALLNVNQWTAAFGSSLIDVGLMAVTAIQGFVYGVYMTLLPVFISYGLAIIIFITPFMFLMGLIVPAQAPAVIAAPIIGIAFLKTVNIGLIVLDHVFIYLMFWVDHINLSDPVLYKSVLILMHLTASVMLFSVAGFILFGMRDPGAFAQHIGGLDKAGQISFNEVMKYGAAPVAVAAKGLQLAKSGVEATGKVGGYAAGQMHNVATERIQAAEKGRATALAEGRMEDVAKFDKTINRWEGVNDTAGALLTVGSFMPVAGKGLRKGYASATDRTGEIFRATQRAGGVRMLQQNDPGEAILNAVNSKHERLDQQLKTHHSVPSGMLKGVPMGDGQRSLDGITKEVRSLIDRDIGRDVSDPATLARLKDRRATAFNTAIIARQQNGTLGAHYKTHTMDDGKTKGTFASVEALKNDAKLSDKMIEQMRAKGEIHTIDGKEFGKLDGEGDVGRLIKAMSGDGGGSDWPSSGYGNVSVNVTFGSRE